VQPLSPLCLCGVAYSEFINHRDTENTEIAQRRVTGLLGRQLAHASLDGQAQSLRENADVRFPEH